MVFVVSLNGPDNVGKTTQLGLFPRSYSTIIVGGLHDCDGRISQMLEDGSLKDWWWNSSEEDFVCTIYAALGRRSQHTMNGEETTFALLDRGKVMFDAVIAAVFATKSKEGDLDEARLRRYSIIQENSLQVPGEELAILLKHGKTLEDSVRISLERENKPVDDRYRRYQTFLQRELQYQEDHGAYQHTILASGPDTHREVQDEIRRVVKSYRDDPQLTPVLHNITRVYALSGLSESGKSTFAQKPCEHFGPSLAFRSKIVYFNDEASETMRKSLYELSEKEQATLLLHGLERFSYRYYWLKILTVESLHRDTVAMWLKTWMGDKLQIIFVDTSEALRLERSLVPLNDLVINDDMKRERGVELIRQRADFILDNNGSLDDSLQQLLRYVGLI